MSKKYDNNLQEIKETGTFATNTTYDLGFTCDVCGRKTQGTTIVNGMKFCAKCYQEIFEDYYGACWQKVTELKQILAEKNKEIEILKYKLKRTEKDKEIEELKAIVEGIKTLKESGCKIEDFIMIDTKEIRHQICEKIREEAFPYYYLGKVRGFIVDMELLDQIEKGE